MSNTDSGVLFSQSAARQTAVAVRKSQSEPLDGTGRSTGRRLHVNDEVWVTIVGNIDSGGHYLAHIMSLPTADINADNDAAAADFGTAAAPAYGAVYAMNAPEIGKTTHALSSGRVCKGTVLRRQEDDTVWVGIESYELEDCTT